MENPMHVLLSACCLHENMLRSYVILGGTFVPVCHIVAHLTPFAKCPDLWSLKVSKEWDIRELTQQDSWRTKDDRMTKKCGARLCMPNFMRHFFVILLSWVFQPSCWVSISSLFAGDNAKGWRVLCFLCGKGQKILGLCGGCGGCSPKKSFKSARNAPPSPPSFF